MSGLELLKKPVEKSCTVHRLIDGNVHRVFEADRSKDLWLRKVSKVFFERKKVLTLTFLYTFCIQFAVHQTNHSTPYSQIHCQKMSLPF